jgi:hypothetical protein
MMSSRVSGEDEFLLRISEGGVRKGEGKVFLATARKRLLPVSSSER